MSLSVALGVTPSGRDAVVGFLGPCRRPTESVWCSDFFDGRFLEIESLRDGAAVSSSETVIRALDRPPLSPSRSPGSRPAGSSLNTWTAVTRGERIAQPYGVGAFAAGVVTNKDGGLIEQQLAPDTSGAEVVPDAPCLAELVDEHQPEPAWGFGVTREHARSQA